MKTAVQNMTLAERLEALYRRYNRRAFVHPDPIERLYEWGDVREREIVALLAATLAYGRVRQILASLERALAPMGPSPRRFLERSSHAELEVTYADFKHRVVKGRDVGFTERRQADLATALEVTAAFRGIRPDDPVRYDFTLTRLGIRDDTVDPALLLEAQSAGRVRGD